MSQFYKFLSAGRGGKIEKEAIVKEPNKQPDQASNSSKGIKRGPWARQVMP